MSGVIPLFKSHYSLGRSILTLEGAGQSFAGGFNGQNSPDSILDIAKEFKLDKVFLVDDNMSGFLQAYSNCKEINLELIFGLRLSICGDMHQKDDDSKSETCKYIIFIKNLEGYKRLVKIYTKASREGFYYYPRIDFKNLNELWDSNDLELAVPFYDSFIFSNVMGSAFCIPDFSKIKPVFFLEDNDLPFDDLVRGRVEQYCQGQYEMQETKSIYYESRTDFEAYQTYKCICGRGFSNKALTLNSPNLDHCGSPEFCFESYLDHEGS